MRVIWLAVGWLCVALGVLGVALPVLPTTPFLLLAAYAFARSSPRLHDWLVMHPLFGPPIEDWRREGAISRRAKRLAILSMAAVFLISLALGVGPLVLAVQGAALTCAAAFILTRPNPSAKSENAAE